MSRHQPPLRSEIEKPIPEAIDPVAPFSGDESDLTKEEAVLLEREAPLGSPDDDQFVQEVKWSKRVVARARIRRQRTEPETLTSRDGHQIPNPRLRTKEWTK